jgi:RNA polymerase sigma-70 factor (ECF subfamily)
VTEEDDALEAVLARARAAWPSADAPAAAFRAHLEERFPGSAPLVERLAGVRVDELWLAFACGRGSDGALSRLTTEWQVQVASKW